MIYVAAPYTIGDVGQNVRRSILACEKLVEMGYTPYNPLLSHFWHMISPHEYEYWLAIDFEVIKLCDGILRLPGESAGADQEIEFAKSLGIPVYYSIEELP